MHGFGTGRIGPHDHTLSQFEEAARRGLVRGLPRLVPIAVPRDFVDHIRPLPRTGYVTAAEVRSLMDADPLPSAAAGDLLLPAEEFLFEMEPMQDDFATARIVHVRRFGQVNGRAARVVVNVLSRVLGTVKWCVTIPGTMETLAECNSDLGERRAASEEGFTIHRGEMSFASYGLAILDARQRGVPGAARD